MVANLDWLRLGTGGALLAYAAVQDLRTRRVPNLTWLVGGAVGAALLLVDWWGGRAVRPVHLVIIALLLASAYLLWYFHLLAGGADAKALMMLAVLLPLPLRLEAAGHAFPVWTSPFPPALVVLANSLLAFVVVPLVFFSWNGARGDVRWPAMFLGYRVRLAEVPHRFVWLMERAQARGPPRLALFASRTTPQQQSAHLRRLKAQGVRRVWVTPKFPFMVPLLAGFLAAFFLGDLLTRFLVAPLLPGRLP